MPLADCPSSRERRRMSEPKKRYPADRIKLHALLERKENELCRLTEEVNQLRARVKEADQCHLRAVCADAGNALGVPPHEIRHAGQCP